jgi:hypothetical protein
MPNFGFSFQPGADAQGGMREQAIAPSQGGAAPSPQQAVKLLSLRVPKTLPSNAPIARSLLTGPGSAAPGAQGLNSLIAALMQVFQPQPASGAPEQPYVPQQSPQQSPMQSMPTMPSQAPQPTQPTFEGNVDSPMPNTPEPFDMTTPTGVYASGGDAGWGDNPYAGNYGGGGSGWIGGYGGGYGGSYAPSFIWGNNTGGHPGGASRDEQDTAFA